MRRLQSKNLSALQKLTNFRKTILTSELAKLNFRIDKKAEEIDLLKESNAAAETIDELMASERWERWKMEELQRLNNEYALLRLEKNQLVRLVGRAVAEDAVTVHLKAAAKVEESTQLRRRAEQNTSHLLPNDVRDQDI